jgi:Dolichyl-phosphate-mannose-protein mannosyltransferase
VRPGRGTRRLGAELGGVALLLLAALLVRVPTLGQPLLEAHGFRQTQTAYTALLFKNEGISLLHPKLPVLGDPFEVPFEFPAFQLLASIVMRLGMEPDTAMRVTALACFLLTGVLLYGFVRRFAGRSAAVATLVVFLFSSFAMLWSRASMIEYLATAAAVAYVWAAIEWRERRRGILAVAAVAFGALACLVKITTGAIYLLPVLFYVSGSDRAGLRGFVKARLDPLLAVVVLVPLAAGLAWTRHADAIKDDNPLTRWLTSDALRAWNFGTFDQRLDLANWLEVANRIILHQLGLIMIFVLLVGVLQRRNRSLWLGWAASGVAGIALFFNLHVVHDYYQAAITPVTAVLVGVGFSALFHARPMNRYAHPAAVLAVIGMVVGAALALDSEYWRRSWRSIDPDDSRLVLARSITAHSDPDQPVAVLGFDWSPIVLYYARRKGTMFSSGVSRAETLAALDSSYQLVAISSDEPPASRAEVLAHWRTASRVGEGVYRVGGIR